MDIMKLEGATGLGGAWQRAIDEANKRGGSSYNDGMVNMTGGSMTVVIPNYSEDDYDDLDPEEIAEKVSEATIKAIKSSIDDNDSRNIIVINNIIGY